MRRTGTGGYSLIKLYRYVLPHWVGFLHRFGLKTVYTLPILVWNRVWFSAELWESVDVLIVSIPNE